MDDGTIGSFDETLGWGQGWDFASTACYLTSDQIKAFWHLKLFVEDKSEGIHNPTYAAQLLYDAADTLGLPVGIRP